MKNLMKSAWPLLVAVVVIACGPAKDSSEAMDKLPVLTDLFGKEYYVPTWTREQKAKLDSNLNVARKNFEADPSEDNYIWYGRRLGYRYHYDKAIEVLTEGLEKFPDSYKLLRHRGHRYISIREFDKAIADLTKAAELMEGLPIETEPDGQPNKMNIPLSSTQFNVWYHLALAHYLKGDFDNAKKAYFSCLSVSGNNDLMVATIDWLYMTYQRQGKPQAADSLLLFIDDSMQVIENDSYLNRLKLYSGKIKPEELLNPDPKSEDYDLALATQGYGVGNWYLYHGDTLKAKSIFSNISKGKHFSAFGFIAAESELAWLKGCDSVGRARDFCLNKRSRMAQR